MAKCLVPNNGTIYKSLLEPGVEPRKIGHFLFNTCNTQVFDMTRFIPATAREITVTVYQRSGAEKESSVFNIWIWTELEDGRKDTKFKRCHRYAQSAISYDSETFSFSYSSKYPKLYLKTDMDAGQNMLLELFAIGYTE